MESEADKRKMRAVVKSVKMILRVLQSSLRHEANNLSFVFKQVSMISQFYLDRHDVENIGLHFVARIAAKILLEQVKTSDSIQAYPRDIALPPDLYQLKESSADPSKAQKGARGAAGLKIQRGLEEAELAIDRVLQITGGTKGSSSSRHAAVSSPAPAAKRGVGSDTKAPKRKAGKATSADREEPGDGDDLPEQGAGAKKRKLSGALSVPAAPKKEQEPAPQPTRALPKRGAKGAVNYADPAENDREADGWNREAAAVNSRRRASREQDHPLVAGRVSTSKAVLPAQEDDDEEERESPVKWSGDSDEEVPRAVAKQSRSNVKGTSRAVPTATAVTAAAAGSDEDDDEDLLQFSRKAAAKRKSGATSHKQQSPPPKVRCSH